MPSTLDESPDRPEGVPEAAGDDQVAKWLANSQCEHDAATLADALELWWLDPEPDAADLIADCIFCLRHSKQRAEAAEAEVVRLREALKRYGVHDVGCPAHDVPELSAKADCDCGLRQALENSND